MVICVSADSREKSRYLKILQQASEDAISIFRYSVTP